MTIDPIIKNQSKSVELTRREAIMLAKQCWNVSALPFGGGYMKISREDVQDAMNIIDKLTEAYDLQWIDQKPPQQEIKEAGTEKKGFFRGVLTHIFGRSNNNGKHKSGELVQEKGTEPSQIHESAEAG